MTLEDKIKQKKAHLAVVGLGYVGLPLAIEFARSGFDVTGIDENKNKVDKVNKGENYIIKEEQELLKSLVKSKKIKAVHDFSVLNNADVIFICVPTPLTKHREPDISYVESVTTQVAKYLKKGQLIVLESTTYPGTTEEVMLPMLSKNGFRVGKDFYLAFSPERVDPGNKFYTTKNTAKIIGGMTEECRHLTKLLYSKALEVVHVASSPRTAEMVKLLENIFRCVNIALVNELALLCKKMDISIWEVIDLASTKPYGFMPFYPGPGLGGHCLLKDEYIYLKRGNGLTATTIGKEFEDLNKGYDIQKHDFLGTKFIKPVNTKILSFDLNNQKNCYKEVKMLTKRYYHGEILTFITKDGRKLSVTDRHPMIIYNRKLIIKSAIDTKVGDKLVIDTNMPQELINFDIKNESYLKLSDFAVVKIKEIEKNKGADVYSMEVKDTNTFVTSYGIITHNCIPIDPFYLTWKAREYDFQTKFIELAGEINMQMPYYVVNMAMEALNSQNKTLKDAKVLVLGAAYKKDIDDPRESPSLKIIETLTLRGAKVSYNDDYIPEVKAGGKSYKSVSIENLKSYDCIIIATDHSYYDYKKITQESNLIIDSRNALKEYKNSKIWRL